LVQAFDSAIVAFISLAESPLRVKALDNSWSIDMSGLRFVGAGVAAALLALWSQEPTAQGLLEATPQPFDGILSHAPLGPPQKFGDLSPGSEVRSTRMERTPIAQPQQADAARSPQVRTAGQSSPISKPRRTAARSFARQQERTAAGSGSLLALAPINQQHLRARPFCFPSSTIHLRPSERDACNGGAPAVKGRFEELLNE
jgi:hypothetical protein